MRLSGRLLAFSYQPLGSQSFNFFPSCVSLFPFLHVCCCVVLINSLCFLDSEFAYMYHVCTCVCVCNSASCPSCSIGSLWWKWICTVCNGLVWLLSVAEFVIVQYNICFVLLAADRILICCLFVYISPLFSVSFLHNYFFNIAQKYLVFPIT